MEQYLIQAFPKADLKHIGDSKRMAQRLVDEFAENKNNDRDDLRGQVIVSTQEQSPVQAIELENVYPQQQLFAHLNTLNQVEQTEQVFIRWIDRNTGEVLLFSPQNISQQSSKKWISFAPFGGWKVGIYDVRYYQMNDDLQPIAQTSFSIRSLQ